MSEYFVVFVLRKDVLVHLNPFVKSFLRYPIIFGRAIACIVEERLERMASYSLSHERGCL